MEKHLKYEEPKLLKTIVTQFFIDEKLLRNCFNSGNSGMQKVGPQWERVYNVEETEKFTMDFLAKINMGIIHIIVISRTPLSRGLSCGIYHCMSAGNGFGRRNNNLQEDTVWILVGGRQNKPNGIII